MKEYELYLPVNYNDGSPVEKGKFEEVEGRLLGEFGRATFFPRPNEGLWRKDGELHRDGIVVYRVLAKETRKARAFFAELKEHVKSAFRQKEVLITERDVGVM